MRRALLGMLLVLAACAEPTNENVSREGPTTSSTSTTERDETTTTAKPTTTTAAGPVEVARFSGAADSDTPNFTVKESWELHWRIEPSEVGSTSMGVRWIEPTETFSGDGIMISTPTGSSLVREGGTFYFEVSRFGAGSWEVWVVDVPN